MTCGECGATLPERARFCSDCGARVDEGREHELRKTVTLLFTDVTGSTVLGEQLDPETYRALMGRYFAVARTAVERHGGTVEKFVGDAVLAVFGIPEVREDDALRAVRAAAELRAGIHALSEALDSEIGVSLQVRTGVNTGQVVAGSARAGGAFATGDAVNTAARLEQEAPPGEVLLGAATYELVRDAVEVEAVEPIIAKGKSEPVPAYRLVGVSEAERGRARRFDRALVGRERESRALLDTLDRAVELERGHLVTVLGPPGIGKTRLVADFVKELGDRVQVVTGRCVSYGQGITYFPVVQLLREALRLQGDESTELTRHSLEQLMADAPDSARVTDLLLALLGKDAEPGSREDTFWAVRRAVEQLASHRPLVVTVDDLHWAEPTLLELIEHLRDEVRDLPLLLVCQARPELLESRPGWGGGTLNSVTFGLEPFTTDQTQESLADLLDGRVDPAVARAVTEWAGGNPLFVEEAVGHLVERGLLVRANGGWGLAGDLAQADVPPTVAALLAARLDLLPDDQRALVERLSIAGLELTEEDAAVLAGRERAQVSALLTALGRRDLMRRRRTEQGEVWSFKHILVRDAAYESLPKAIRAELHERYADHVASTGDEAGGERAAFVAHHLEQALHNRTALGVAGDRVADLAGRTADAFLAAAVSAWHRFDMSGATTWFQRLADLDAAPAERRREGRLRLLALFFSIGAMDELPELVERFSEEAGSSEVDEALPEMLRLWHAVDAGRSVDPRALRARADEVVALAEAADDRAALLLALNAKMDANMTLGLWSGLADLAAEVARAGGEFEQNTLQLLRVISILHGARAFSWLGHEVELQRATAHRTPVESLMLECTEAVLLAVADDERAVAAVDELERWHYENQGRHMPLNFGVVCTKLLGQFPRTLRYQHRLVDLWEAAGELSLASTTLAEMACIHLERGDPDGVAASLLERAAAVTSPFDAASVSLVATARSLVAGRVPDPDAVDRHASEALDALEHTDMLWMTADVRRWLAVAHRGCGDLHGERRHLERALELYRHKGIVHWTRVVEQRLAELGQER